MEIQITHRPSYALATATLNPNEIINVEPGAMVSLSEGVTVQTHAQGGFFSGVKRMFGGENFFMNTFTAPTQGGEITLAPQLPGDMLSLSLEPDQTFLLKSGAYIASESEISFSLCLEPLKSACWLKARSTPSILVISSPLMSPFALRYEVWET